MSGSPPNSRPASAAAVIYERAAERLLDVLLAAWQPSASFPSQMQALFSAALADLAAKPENAYALTVWPFAADRDVFDRHLHWQRRYADQLRVAVARYQDAHQHPPFFEPIVIAGLQWQVSRHLQAQGPTRLVELSPKLTEFAVTCYLHHGPDSSLSHSRSLE